MPKADRFYTWLWLSLAAILLLSVRLHHLQMPLERDEGEYALGGWMILQGKLPYLDFFNMKFPGIYFLYAGFIALFGEGELSPHLGLLIFQAGTLVLLFAWGARWLSRPLAALATLVAVLPMLSPTAVSLPAHATHFVSFFAMLAVYLFTLAQAGQGWRSSVAWLGAGAAAALAMLMKQQGFFVPLGLGLALMAALARRTLAWRPFLARTALLLAGFSLPLAAMAAWLGAHGVLDDARLWAWEYAGAYGSMLPLDGKTLKYIFLSTLGTVTGVWLLWLFGIAGMIRTLVLRLPWSGQGMASLMLLLAMVSVVPGFYFRPHYFIVCYPFLGLALCSWLQCHSPRMQRWGHWFTLLAAGPPIAFFSVVWWVASPAQANSMVYGSSIFVQAQQMAAYLEANSSPGEKILVIGSEPELCYLAQRMPATPFLYWYTHDDNHPLQPQMRARFKVEASLSVPQTRWVVVVNDLFSLYHFPVRPNETVSWFNQHLRTHQYQMGMVMAPQAGDIWRQSLFSIPAEIRWRQYTGEQAGLILQQGGRYMAAFRRP